MRDQQDNDSIITTPWCISVQAKGHSFSPTTEAYLPRALFNPVNIVMPSATVGHKVYQTVVMVNNGNSPIDYDFQLDQRLEISSVGYYTMIYSHTEILLFIHHQDNYRTIIR